MTPILICIICKTSSLYTLFYVSTMNVEYINNIPDNSIILAQLYSGLVKLGMARVG